MRKFLVIALALPVLSFASSLDMSTLKCNSLSITSATTLQQVQNSCMIKKQETHKGMYQVEFTNTTTNKSVSCDFANNDPAAVVNGCH